MLFEFIRRIYGVIFALMRLVSLSIVMLVNGIHGILFNKTETIGLTMHAAPMSVENGDKVAYIDKLEQQNADIPCGLTNFSNNGAPFRKDEDILDDEWVDDEEFNDDDFDEGDDNDGENNHG